MTRRAPRRLPLGGTLLLLLVSALGARTALADPPEEPWARSIREGIVSQDRELARSSADAIVRRLASRAGRQSDVVSLYLLGRAYGKQGDTASAFDTYAEVLRLEPRCWFAWRDRGVLRALKGDKAGAEADLKQAASLRLGYVDALEPLGMLLFEAKRYDEAIRYLSAAVDAAPGLDRARLKIVEAQLEAHRPDDALRSLDVLLSKTPNDPSLRHVRGRILVEKQDYAGAQRIFKQLATENPDAVLPLRAWLDAAARAKDVDPEDGIWVLERLRRIARTPEEKRKLGDQIDAMRRAGGSKGGPGPSAPQGPPTPEVLARALRAPEAAARLAALHYVLRSPKEVSEVKGDLLLALVERLDPAREPDPAARILALAVLERYPSPEFAVLLRASLRDEDPNVRCKAADVLGSVGNPLAVASLMRLATGADLALATSARIAIYEIAKVNAPLAEEDPSSQAAAFKAWWATARAQELKLAAMDAVFTAADRRPDELLFPFALDDDPAVWSAAWRHLARLVPLVKGTTPRDLWMKRLPTFSDAALVPERREAFLDAMTTWWLERPQG